MSNETHPNDVPTPGPGRTRASYLARLGLYWSLRGLRVVGHLASVALQLALALVVIFEEWGWQPIARLAARIARWAPIARIEAVIVRLPPYPALLVFAAPSVLLLPLKLASLWLIANGYVIWATLLFAFAKVAGTAFLARLFQLTQPALMQLAWFARLYGIFVPWKEEMLARLRASRAWRIGRVVKSRIKKAVRGAWVRWRPSLEPTLAWLRGLMQR